MWFSKKDEPTLRFDGIYRAQIGNAFSWMRFYADGMIVDAGTVTDFDDGRSVAKWLHRDYRRETLLQDDDMVLRGGQLFNLYLPTGYYTTRGRNIEFSLEYPTRLQRLSTWEYQIAYTREDYKGMIYIDKIALEKTVNHIEYQFLKVPVPPSKGPRKETMYFPPNTLADKSITIHMVPKRR